MVKQYVDGFVIVIKKDKVSDYKKMAAIGGKLWMKHGALQYVETISEELDKITEWGGVSFPKLTKAKENEVIIFSYIMYKSKAHRNKVNKLVMADPEMKKCEKMPMPFEMKKMSMGGFETLINL